MKASAETSGLAKQPTRKTTQRQLNAAATRDRLIEATIVCMANYGPAGVTLERVTDAAGVSRGLVRHHFGTKHRLLLEAFQRLADEQRAAFLREAAEGTDAVATLRDAIARSFRDALAAPARAHAWFGFWQAGLGDPELRQINERVHREERERYTALFRAAAQQRRLVLDETEAGRGLVALADGVWNELVMDSTSLTVEEALTLCDHYIDMVLARGRTDREEDREEPIGS
jgi:TetR/AcrR family transcriptional regulator, transcriptional repressor of bet genes